VPILAALIGQVYCGVAAMLSGLPEDCINAAGELSIADDLIVVVDIEGLKLANSPDKVWKLDERVAALFAWDPDHAMLVQIATDRLTDDITGGIDGAGVAGDDKRRQRAEFGRGIAAFFAWTPDRRELLEVVVHGHADDCAGVVNVAGEGGFVKAGLEGMAAQGWEFGDHFAAFLTALPDPGGGTVAVGGGIADDLGVVIDGKSDGVVKAGEIDHLGERHAAMLAVFGDEGVTQAVGGIGVVAYDLFKIVGAAAGAGCIWAKISAIDQPSRPDGGGAESGGVVSNVIGGFTAEESVSLSIDVRVGGSEIGEIRTLIGEGVEIDNGIGGEKGTGFECFYGTHDFTPVFW